MKKLLFLCLFLVSFKSFSQQIAAEDIRTFATKTGALTTIDKGTRALSFLRFPSDRALQLKGITAREKAMSFLNENGNLFAMQADDNTYRPREGRKDEYGLDYVVLQQYYRGVPVYDGILKFRFNKAVDLTSMNGNFISVSKLDMTPDITADEAGKAALKYVTGQFLGRFKAPLKINKNTLFVFQKGLAQGYHGPVHLVYEVEVRNDVDVREFLYIDAHSKELVEQFTGMHQIDRKLYETSVSSGNLKWQESNGLAGSEFAALDTWQKSEVLTSGHIYNLMKNAFGYTSYNNAGASMITINNNPLISCPNANWNGVTANYCTGVASDDVVAHEWGHAYTEYTSGLIYAWQSGALNEAFSDIWGETVDQLNAYMDETENNALRTGCASSTRWQLGEKTTAFSGGALRDMWDPTCKGDPGKVSDTQYWCSSSDAGGVHINSGIINHAYALLVDGGTYNGQTINGLGLTKAAHIFWRAQRVYMTSTTDFAAMADILQAALEDLIDVPLNALSTGDVAPGLSDQVIVRADGIELAKVIAAVEMRAENNCNFQPILAALPDICVGASSTNAIYFENFESGIGSWSTSTSSGVSGSWVSRKWEVSSAAPGGRSGKVMFGVDYQGGNCASSLQNGVIRLISPEIAIPSGASGPFLMAFDHYVAIEPGYDGGLIRYRIDGGSWTQIPSSAFVSNGYNVTLVNSGNNNPLKGLKAFSGTDAGSSFGSWGQSRISLTALGLDAGETIEFRWEMGTDGCGGIDGWYIDNVRVYSCAVPSVQFAVGSSRVNEGEAATAQASPNECLKYVEKLIEIKINKAPSQPVTVTLNTPTGTATAGSTADYSISPNSFVLQSGTLSQNVTLRIYNDAYIEGDETISLSYTLTSPSGGDAFADAENQTHTITIVDDDLGPQYNKTLVSENFNAGLPAGWTVVGGGSYPDTWGVAEFSNAELDPAGRPLLIINSDAAGKVALDKVIESVSFNTAGMSTINLSFIENFQIYNESDDIADEQATVDVWDGTAWHTLLTQTELTGSSGSWSTPASRNIAIPVAYSGPAMKIRFRYTGNYDYYWAIDNVKVEGFYSKEIQTAETVTADNQYLGPNATVYFYDPASGNVLSRIKNLTSHNYGCTTVAVDRAGNDEVSWVNGHKITRKTFKVTPASNNASGQYEITLYYKGTELPTFSGSMIKSIGKSTGSIATADPAGSSFKAIEETVTYGSGFAYKATFTSGFSGFGLSDASVGGPLPVTLTSFTGRHSIEGNTLQWTTSAEYNNKYFAIERSADAKVFELLGTVNATGNSSTSRTYSFLDKSPAKGISYYRLKQVDYDGKTEKGHIISIDAGDWQTVRFFPNPVSSVMNIELPDDEAKEVSVEIVNVAGQVVLSKSRVPVKNGLLAYDLTRLPAGIYQIILRNLSTVYHFKILKH